MAFFKVNSTQVLHNFNLVDAEEIGEWWNYYSVVFGTVISTALFAIFVYWLFYVPCNWEKRLDDTGYNLAFGSAQYKNSSGRKDTINRMRRLRNIGLQTLPPPFPNGWYSIMESSALLKGKATSLSCLGENFVIFRTDTNKVHVLDAYCPHMGANMGVGGHVRGENIECPFHQWSFSGSDGRCVDVPYSSCVPQGVSVRKWISCEANDNIFIWHHVDDDESPWELPIVTEINNKEFVYHGRNEFYVNCHIQEIPENGADLAHFTAIHKASLLAGNDDPTNSAFANTGKHCWEAIWKPSEFAKHLATVTLNHSLEILPNFHIFQMDVKGEQFGPAYVQLHMKSPTFGRIEVLQTITPIEPLVQKVVHRFYAPRVLGPFMKFVVIGESIMFERDINMWNHKTFRNKPQLVKEDAAIKSFRSWFLQFYSENSKTFAESHNNLEW